MKEEKFIFLSADNKTTIHGTWWEPEQLPKAVLQISHGLTEYGQRYRDFAEFLTRYGYAVAANDVIGHGKSVTPGEEPVHIEKWEDTVKDFETCRRKTGERFGDLPYYTMGFSLGSFILQSYLTEHAAGIQGIILAGTGMIPDFQLKAAKAYVKYIGKKAGMNRKDPRIHELSFGTYNKHFDGGKKAFSWLYADETCRLAYEKEQKGSEDMTCGFFYQFLSGMEYVNRHRKKLKLQAPVLLISGSQDPVGDFGKGVEKLYSRYRKMGITADLKLIPGYRHDILHDRCGRKVWEYIREWMERKDAWG